MLPRQPYHPGLYPPGPQYPQFSDDHVGQALNMADEIRSKLAHKRQGMLPFHMERLQHGRLLPLKIPSHEMEIQTDNPMADANVQTEVPHVPRDRQRDHPDDEEQDVGGGQGSRGGAMEMARRAARGAQAGARHFKPVGDITGALAGSLAVAGGYAVGALGSVGLYGLKSAGGVILGGGEASDAEESGPTPSPLAVSGAGSSQDGPPRPAEAVPPYLLDREEREAAAKKPSVLGQFASREQDSRRKKKQELDDKREASRRDAEETIRRNLGP